MRNIVICGLGYISERVAQGVDLAQGALLYGVQSRDLGKAQAAARRLGARVAFGSYEDVLADPGVDAVYLCTPNNTHVVLARQALEAGKSVICEKPLAPSRRDARELFSLAKAKGCLLMEAEKTAFSPLVALVREEVGAGAIGELVSIEAAYAYDRLSVGADPAHWVFGDAGGCALDIGVYPACFANAIVGSPVARVECVRDKLAPYSVDFGVRSYVTYANGVVASISASWCYDLPGKGGACVHGTRGFIEVPCFWKGTEATLRTSEGSRVLHAKMASDFTPQIEAAVAAMEHGLSECPGMGEAETLAILEVLGVG